MEALLESGANKETPDELKCTPLHLACKKGSFEAVDLLLKKKPNTYGSANIYAQDHRSWTPLHYASYNGHAKIVNHLLKFEADFDQLASMRSSQNKLALHIAKDDKVKKAFHRKLTSLFCAKLNTFFLVCRYLESV